MAGRLKKLTEEQAKKSVRMYESGMSLQPIADEFKVSRQSMWDLLRRRTKMRPQKRTGKDNHFHRGGRSDDARVHNIFEQAVQDGVVIRKTVCEQCGDSGVLKNGRSKVDGHHCDYNKPLEVLWLCHKCHYKWHTVNKPVRKRMNDE